MSTSKAWTFFSALVVLLLFAVDPVSGQFCPEKSSTRVALVIGNSGSGRDIISGRQDAEAMAQVLCDIGFAVVRLGLDANLESMRSALDDFRGRIRDAEDVVFFFSGHGFQINGVSYLLPHNSDIDRNDPQMPISDVIHALHAAPRAKKFIFLDACRTSFDLPVSGGGRLQDVEGWAEGLAREPNLPNFTLISYSAAFGRLAFSGVEGGLSPYTEALVETIGEPGLEIRDLLSRVHHMVRGDRSQPQAPKEESLAEIPHPFYFRPPVRIGLEVKFADDGLLAFLNGALVLSSDTEENRSVELDLRAGTNELLLLVANGKSFHSGQNWRLTQGWGYELTVSWPQNRGVIDCGAIEPATPCFQARERIPFKGGPHHGGVFPVAKARIEVDHKTAELTAEVDPQLWQRTDFWAQHQKVLWEGSLSSLPLRTEPSFDKYLNLLQAAVGLIEILDLKDEIRLPNPDEIFAVVLGNSAFEEFVQVCMVDRLSDRLKDLAVSLRATLDASEIKPFDSFDRSLEACVRAEAVRRPDLPFRADQIRIWSALDQRRSGSGAGTGALP